LTELDRLITTHRRRGVLLDSSLLLLHLVGLTDRQRITSFKRTDVYTVADFDLLELLLNQFDRRFTTPQVVTEVSNLGKLHGPEFAAFRDWLRRTVEVLEENPIDSRTATQHYLFARLGVTDAAIAVCCSQGPLVLTDDLDLYGALRTREMPAINFNHLRDWTS
jgi:hypothetical protein